MTLKQQCEAWKSLALAYEVFIEDAADMDAEGMAAALKSINRSRARLAAEGRWTRPTSPKTQVRLTRNRNYHHDYPMALLEIPRQRTCGLHSMAVLLQFAEAEGPIKLHEVWRRPIGETLDIIEWLCETTSSASTSRFDWFHSSNSTPSSGWATRIGFRRSISTRSPCWSPRAKMVPASSLPPPWT